MAPLPVTRAGVAGTVIALVVALVCARLGVWQLDRLEQRRQRNAAVEERMRGDPMRLLDLPPDTSGLLYRRITIHGEYDVAHSIVLRGRALNGVPGVHVLTPLRAAGGAAVLVNRGWVPSADAATIELDALPPPADEPLSGLALPFPADGEAVVREGEFRRTWTRLDLAGLRRQFPYRLTAFYIQALPAGEDARVAGAPVPLPPPALDEGPHLGYALQWFGFATISLVGWAAVALRRRARRPRLRITRA